MPILGSRKSHTFITTPHEPLGSYGKLGDGDDNDNDNETYPEPTEEVEQHPLPIFSVDDEKHWKDIKEPRPTPKQDCRNILEIQITRQFNLWRINQRIGQPRRKATHRFSITARSIPRKLGQRSYHYKRVPIEPRPAKTEPSFEGSDTSSNPKKRKNKKNSKFYRYPGERTNQHPTLRTYKAQIGYAKAIEGHFKFLCKQTVIFEKQQGRVKEVEEKNEEQNQQFQQLQLQDAHEQGLQIGFYLCKGAKSAPWGSCKQYCMWPGCTGPEPGINFKIRIAMANNNINTEDNLPVRFPFLDEQMGLEERLNMTVPEPQEPGCGFQGGFDLDRAWGRLHHTVRRTQQLHLNKRYEECIELCDRYLNGPDNENVRPRLKALDKAHLAFTAGGAARFAYKRKWNLERRISEVEKYMNLTVVLLLSHPKVLKENLSALFYADVKAKVHYWGELHQLHFLMPQRDISELMEVLADERYRRLVRLYQIKKKDKREEWKKGYSLQIFKVKTEDAAKPLVKKQKGWRFGRRDRSEKVEEGGKEVTESKEGIFKRLWKTFWKKGGSGGGQQVADTNENAGDQAQEEHIELNILDMLREREMPSENNIIWVSKDGQGRRRKSPMPEFNAATTIHRDIFQDYPPDAAYRRRAL
ncbi:hypothetical protein TWF281_011356 [Arthrobotrys megalospora]